MIILFITALLACLILVIIKNRQTSQMAKKIFDQAETMAKMKAIVEAVKDRKCSAHAYGIGEKVKLVTDINGISGTIVGILTRKNREPHYTIHQGGRTVTVVEHLLRPIGRKGIEEISMDLERSINV